MVLPMLTRPADGAGKAEPKSEQNPAQFVF